MSRFVARLLDSVIIQYASSRTVSVFQVAVDVRIGVARQIEHERLLIDDAREAIADVHRTLERQLAALNLAHDAEEDRELHRRGGVEVMIGVVRPLNRRFGVEKRDAEVFELVVLFDFQDVPIERDFRRGDRIGMRRQRKLFFGFGLSFSGHRDEWY